MATYIPELTPDTVKGKRVFLVSVLHVELDKRCPVYGMPTDLSNALSFLEKWFQHHLKSGDVLRLDGVSYSTVAEVLDALRLLQ